MLSALVCPNMFTKQKERSNRRVVFFMVNFLGVGNYSLKLPNKFTTVC